MTWFGVQPRLKAKLGSRMISVGQWLRHQLLSAPFQAGEGGAWDPDLAGGWRPARGDTARLSGSRSPGAVGREADRVLNDSPVRFV